MFPVHAFNAPKVVYDWIESIPGVESADAVEKPKAAVISVSGGGLMSPNTGCNVSTVKRLTRKGYNVVYDVMLVMPSNFIVATNDLLAARLIEVLPEKTDYIAEQILSGKRRSLNPPLIDRIFSKLGEIEKPFAKYYGKWSRVSDACDGCGWCAAHCPAGNINTLREENVSERDRLVNTTDSDDSDKEPLMSSLPTKSSLPTFGNKCHLCLRCFYGCPQKALSPGRFKFIVLKEGFDLGRLEAMVPLKEPVDVDELAKSWYWIGIRKYLLDE